MLRIKYLKKLENSLKNKKITFLIGARQVGKTTLLKQLCKNLKNYAFLPCDEIALKEFESAADLLNYFSLKNNINFSQIKYLILDEIQLVKNIALFLKDLNDNYHFKIFASGSGSLSIFKGIAESLIGRKEIINVYPFSFAEFLQIHNKPVLSLKELTPNIIKIYHNLFLEYLKYGGYPEVITTSDLKQKISILSLMCKSYFQQDIYYYLKHGDLYAFEKFYKLIANSITSLQKFDALRQKIKVHVSKVKEFSFILKNTFILDLLAPFVHSEKKEIKSHLKIYFNDIGIINSIWNNFELIPERKGKLIENYVLNELRKNKKDFQQLYFWRKKSQVEIDFVINNLTNSKLIPIEVKAGSTDIIPQSFRSFWHDYKNKIDFFIVLNKDIYKKRQLENFKVIFMPYFYIGIFLSHLKESLINS